MVNGDPVGEMFLLAVLICSVCESLRAHAVFIMIKLIKPRAYLSVLSH